MTNFKMTVWADCAVPACSPLPGSIKALTLCLSDKLKQTSPSVNNFTKIISHWKIFVNFLPFTAPAASLLYRCWKDDSKHPSLHHGTPCWLTLQRLSTTYMMCLDFLVWYVSLWLIITLKIIIKAAGTYWNVSPVPGTWWIQSYVTLSSLQPLEECSRISILAKQKRTYCSE